MISLSKVKDSDLYTPTEAADLLGISKRGVYRRIEDGRIHATRERGSNRAWISGKDIKQYVEAQIA